VGTNLRICSPRRSRRRSASAALGLGDRVELLLEHDLLGRVLEAEPGQPAPVRRRPGLAAGEHPVVAQQEALELLPGPTHRLHRGRARPHQVAHRLVRRVGHPHPGQLPGPQQARQREGVAPVGLHPVAGPARDQRGRHHRAVVAQRGDLPVQAVAARAGLVADPEPAVLLAEPLDQAPHGLRLVGDLTMEPHRALAAGLGHRDRDPGLVRIQPDAHRPMLVHGSSPMSEARRRPIRRNPRQ
jgi:hypothetical protein